MVLFASILFLFHSQSVMSAHMTSPYPTVVFFKGFFRSSDHYEQENDIGSMFEQRGFNFIYTHSPAGGNSFERAKLLASELTARLAPNEKTIFVGISQGGLDARVLLHDNPEIAKNCSELITVSTPHHGSSLADSLQAMDGYDFSYLSGASWQEDTYLLRLLKGMKTLTRDYVMTEFNPKVPDVEGVNYFSYSTKILEDANSSLKLTSAIMSQLGEPNNDGVVSEESAHWGTFISMFPYDHLAVFSANNEGGHSMEVFQKVITDLKQRL